MASEPRIYLDRNQAEKILTGEIPGDVPRVLVAIALHEDDWRWVQRWCLDFLSDDDPAIRGVAATCLGHLARIHRALDRELVLERLEDLRSDPAIAGSVETAIEDIKQYMPQE